MTVKYTLISPDFGSAAEIIRAHAAGKGFARELHKKGVPSQDLTYQAEPLPKVNVPSFVKVEEVPTTRAAAGFSQMSIPEQQLRAKILSGMPGGPYPLVVA